MPFGAFVEFMPGKQGLLHISEVSWKRLDTLDGVLKEGDKIKIKLVGSDPKTGKFRLSRKVLMEKPEGYVEQPERADVLNVVANAATVLKVVATVVQDQKIKTKVRY